MNKLKRREEESINDWMIRIGSKKKRWIHKIKLNRWNRMFRFGFGFNQGRPFIRIDLWWVGYRISNK